MATTVKPAFVIATLRDGRMTAVNNFRAREADLALLFIEQVRASGAEVNITFASIADGTGLSDEDRTRLEEVLV